MFQARVAALGLPALADVELDHLRRGQRIEACQEQVADRIGLRVHQGREQGVRLVGIEQREVGADVAQGHVGGVVVEAVQLRQVLVLHVGPREEGVHAEDDLVIDPIDVEQLTAGVGVQVTHGQAGASAGGAPDPAGVLVVEVPGVIAQGEIEEGHQLDVAHLHRH